MSPSLLNKDSNDGDARNGAGATAFSCIVNLTNTIIGAGMLGLPGAFAGLGYLGGSLLLLLGAAFSAHGLRLLATSAERTGLPASFYTVATAALPRFAVLIDCAVAVKCFGVATGYLITVGDCMVDAFLFLLPNQVDGEETPFHHDLLISRRFWVAAGLLAALPVSFFKTLDALRFTSALSLILVLVLAVGVVAFSHGLVSDPCEGYYDADGSDAACRGETQLFTGPTESLRKLPIVVFAFTCQQNLFPVVNEIRNRTRYRLNKVIVCSIGSAMLTYLIVAVEGYRTYGNNMSGDLLLSYPQTGIVTVMRILIAVMVVLSYPMQLDPCRRCVLSAVASIGEIKDDWRGGTKEEQSPPRTELEMTNVSGDPPSHSDYAGSRKVEGIVIEDYGHDFKRMGDEEQPQSSKNTAIFAGGSPSPSAGHRQVEHDGKFYAVTIVLLVSSLGIALVVDDLGIVLATVGATGSVLVSYVLPGAIYVRLFRHEGFDTAMGLAYAQLVMGCVVMPAALYCLFKG